MKHFKFYLQYLVVRFENRLTNREASRTPAFIVGLAIIHCVLARMFADEWHLSASKYGVFLRKAAPVDSTLWAKAFLKLTLTCAAALIFALLITFLLNVLVFSALKLNKAAVRKALVGWIAIYVAMMYVVPVGELVQIYIQYQKKRG